MPSAKCLVDTWAVPASPSRNASTRTNWFGSSTLTDQSNQSTPGSDRVPAVKSATSSRNESRCSGLAVNLTTMKIMAAFWGGSAGHGQSQPVSI